VFGASNSCLTYSFRGRTFEFVEVVNQTGLNAGTINVTGPNGTRTLQQPSPGDYLLDLAPATPGLPGGIPGLGQGASFLTAGSYTYQGTGGSDVGPFTATRNFTDGIDWTNKNQLGTINRSQGLTVTWNGGDPSEENIWIFGASFAESNFLSGLPLQSLDEVSGAAFFCSANAGLGSFTVGPEILSALPVSAVISAPGFGTFSTGSLQVGAFGIPRPFDAPGIDIGFFSYTNTASILTDYK